MGRKRARENGLDPEIPQPRDGTNRARTDASLHDPCEGQLGMWADEELKPAADQR